MALALSTLLMMSAPQCIVAERLVGWVEGWNAAPLADSVSGMNNQEWVCKGVPDSSNIDL